MPRPTRTPLLLLALAFVSAVSAATAATLSITSPATLPNATGGVSYSTTLTATGGTPPYKWAIQSGGLPPGLALASTGVISGTASTSAWVYTYKFLSYFRVTDSKNATAYASLGLNVVAPAPAGSGTGGDGSGSTSSGGSSGGTTSTPTTYSLTVTNGTGTGSYAAGTTVNLVANTAPAGQMFAQWTGATVTNAALPNTTLIMPSASAVVVATYQAIPAPAVPAAPSNPILFVTQIPIGFDFTTVGSAFGNHRPDVDSCGRGGDLYIRYPDGTVRNLTAEAGFGSPAGFQGPNSIAVREPSVYWDGTKAIFSMVVGAPASRFAPSNPMWQIYEVTGLGQGQTAVITKVANQPAFNNVSPTYGTNGRIIFVSDSPRNGMSHLYPQLDEYELAPTTTGLWSLDPTTGDLYNLDHTPSGAFSPSVDSFGRVVFVRWDHLQRDQEADIDADNIAAGQPLTYGTFNYSDETATASILAGNRSEIYPEPRYATATTSGHTFNVFFPWMINQDGTAEETIDHIGRHELSGYMAGVTVGDPSIATFNYATSGRFNLTTYLNNFLQIKEDPTTPGRYFGTDGPEFSTHGSGQIVAITAPAGADADNIPLAYITDPISKFSGTQTNHPGHFRDPLPLSNGTLVAVHTAVTTDESQRGVGSDYDFRIKTLQLVNGLYQPYALLTAGFSKSVSYYNSSGSLISYNGALWELWPVEVRARPMPGATVTALPTPEQTVFTEEGVDVAAFQAYLTKNNLALIVSRNVTTRDHADKLQPYNLRIAGTTTQTIGNNGKLYDVSYLQLFEADQIRGFGLRNPGDTPNNGRRVLAQPLNDPASVAANPVTSGAPAGGVQLGTDGSMAAFVPARRATTWQLTDPSGNGVVRERYWLTMQPGEIRSCTSCHGINTHDQAGNLTPTNKPEALRTLLRYWKSQGN
jgi:hypothetical protein